MAEDYDPEPHFGGFYDPDEQGVQTMGYRTHFSQRPTVSVMTNAQIADTIGGEEWTDAELSDPAPRIVLADNGNQEAWVLEIDQDNLAHLIGDLLNAHPSLRWLVNPR